MDTSTTPLQYVIVDHLVHSFIEQDLFDNNVPFANTNLINLLWKLGLGLGLNLQLHYFSLFYRQ